MPLPVEYKLILPLGDPVKPDRDPTVPTVNTSPVDKEIVPAFKPAIVKARLFGLVAATEAHSQKQFRRRLELAL